MVKVLVQINSLALGGTQINAVDLAAEVMHYGYESVLVGPRDTIPDGPSLFEIAKQRGIDVEAFDRPRTTLEGALLMSKLARRHKASMVHIYGSWTARPAWWGPCLGGRRPLALTIYEMAVAPETPKSPALIVGTRYLLEDLAGRVSGVELISPPVDTFRDDCETVDTRHFLAMHELTARQHKIVMVTRLDEDMKATGVEHAIEAMERLAATDAVLVVVGTGDAAARLARQAEIANRRQGRKSVVLVGPMSDPRAAYAAADIVIGMGGSAARALSFGKPLIVAGEFGWYKPFNPQTSKELFRNSFWSDQSMEKPVDRLVSALEEILVDPTGRGELGKFGRRFAVENFSLAAMGAELASIYARSLREYGFRVWSRDLSDEISSIRRWVGATMEPVVRGTRKLGATAHARTMQNGGRE